MSEIIVGIDEVGRGAWAGPVVAGAVILPATYDLPGLRDSKLIPKAERELLAELINSQAIAVGLGWVSGREVDANGLSWAVRESGLRALQALGRDFDKVILDGKHNYLRDSEFETEVIVGADNLVPCVSAAAIVAKVARDGYMAELHQQLPVYGFDTHVGYGTVRHKQALQKHGVSEYHRLSYKPIKELTSVND